MIIQYEKTVKKKKMGNERQLNLDCGETVKKKKRPVEVSSKWHGC